jgi:hypothetical protein
MQANNLAPNPLLSNIAVDFKNRAYVADQILTQVPVPNMLCQYIEWDQGVTFKTPKAEMAQNGTANVLEVKGSKKAITLATRALQSLVDELERTQAPMAQIEAMKTEKLQNALLLDREIRVAAQITTTGLYVTGNTDDLTGSDQWSDDDSDPVGAVIAAHSVLPMDANVFLVGRDVMDRLRVHPAILDALRLTTSAGRATDEQIARLFNVDKVIVASAKFDAAGEGLAADSSLVWQEAGGGGMALLAYVTATPPSPLMDQPTFGYIPTLGGGTPTTRVYRSIDPTAGTGGGLTRIKAETAYETLISAPSMGFLWTSVLS